MSAIRMRRASCNFQFLLLSFLAHSDQVCNDVVQILIAQSACVINRHKGFAGLLDGAQLVLFEQMKVLGRVHHLQAEAVLVESDTLNLLAIRGHDRDRLIFLGKLFGRFREPPSEPATWIAYGLDQGIDGSTTSHRGQVRTNASPFAAYHVTSRAICVAVEELFSASSV